MATAFDIAELRNKILEPTDTEPYTNLYLSGLIDKYGIRGAAKEVWEAKAAAVAHLTDISEGGSSRSASKIHSNYLAIAKTFADGEDEADSVGVRIGTISRL